MLVLEIDTRVRLSTSKTAKSELVAVSGGFVEVGDVKYALTVIKP